MENVKNVTTFEELKEYANGQIVELPPFADGQPFYARLRRPSLLTLVKSGKIPNRLLVTANKLFLNKSVNDENEKTLKEVFGVIDPIIESALIEPSMKDIKEAGIELTDDQMLFIFSYTQQGVKALERFHYFERNNERSSDVEEVR